MEKKTVLKAEIMKYEKYDRKKLREYIHFK
jgi:hypothetical protein